MESDEQANVSLRDLQHMETLSRLVIRTCCHNQQATAATDLEDLHGDLRYIASLNREELPDFVAQAHRHHVTVRALGALRDAALLEKNTIAADWCTGAITSEQFRIQQALESLSHICEALESRGCQVAVIKSLDHWPDLGSDLDLYTTGDPVRVREVMRQEFDARAMSRSIGDCLANKWNYQVPDLSELVEVHVQYLGQTGEHQQLARRIIERRRAYAINGREFHVPAPEERIMIATLQRMYRHFYFRLCDMIDTASLLQSGTLDFDELQSAASDAGIWPGAATFLCLVENYLRSYGGAVTLPESVRRSAQSQHARVRFKSRFLRVPKTIAASLYGRQLLQAGARRDVRALLRLPLLPPLAFSAVLFYGLTGSDKGIW